MAAIAQPATLAVAIEMRPPIAQQAIVPRSGKAAIVAASEPHTMADPVAVVQRRACDVLVGPARDLLGEEGDRGAEVHEVVRGRESRRSACFLSRFSMTRGFIFASPSGEATRETS